MFVGSHTPVYQQKNQSKGSFSVQHIDCKDATLIRDLTYGLIKFRLAMVEPFIVTKAPDITPRVSTSTHSISFDAVDPVIIHASIETYCTTSGTDTINSSNVLKLIYDSRVPRTDKVKLCARL